MRKNSTILKSILGLWIIGWIVLFIINGGLSSSYGVRNLLLISMVPLIILVGVTIKESLDKKDVRNNITISIGIILLVLSTSLLLITLFISNMYATGTFGELLLSLLRMGIVENDFKSMLGVSSIILIVGFILIYSSHSSSQKNIEISENNTDTNKKVIEFKNDKTGEVKNAPIGFSWTTLFLTFFPALMRSDFKWALIQFLLSWFTFGISCFVFPFIYNKLYIKELFNKGFIPFKEEDTAYLINNGFITSNQMEFQMKTSKVVEQPVQIIKEKENQSAAQQIKEFKQLLDEGIITKEEFDNKKSELLK